jgi:predicted ATPase/class 3 adenylate cyclase/DNA-binding CsgD family transcriptional regulator
MSSPPTGTVTFLFTDIEDSTKLWERNPKAMQVALARHDEILREAIDVRGGYVFKTVGDAFCTVFPTAQDALEAALTAQRALFSEEWSKEIGSLRVRIALHAGAAEERDGDYFGPPLNRVARLLSAGHGGQVLLSLAVEELVRDQLPEETALRDLGERRLKDLFRPERVFQLIASDLPSEFPPLRTLEGSPNNLPLQPTPLVGREQEVAEVTQRLSESPSRLLTLTGPGGTGKTRLALQAAADLLEEFEDGVFFISLAALTEPKLVASAVAAPLGVIETADRPLEEGLKEYLREKKLLLLLDNFEQVLEGASLVRELLSVCPNLKVLATSRTPLGIYGEREYPVPPLSLPDTARLPSLEDLTQYEAVRLFIERASDARPDFSITNENASAVAEICARLDGLPLAIELAAARVKVLTPMKMLERLSDRLKLLTGGARDLPERQRTLRATMEWSHALLEEGEKQLFARLSVFAGGRTLEAIEVICDAEDDLPVDVLDAVESLVDKGLLREEVTGGEPRFYMLETVHEYAREKLEESGEAEELRMLHAQYFLSLAEEAEPQLKGGGQQEMWLERLEREHNNLRSALSWTLDSGQVELALRLCGALGEFWYHRGHVTEGQRWLQSTLAQRNVASGVRQAKALALAGWLAWEQGDYEQARVLIGEGLELYREQGDTARIAAALFDLGMVALYQTEFERASAPLEEALAVQRLLDDKTGAARSLYALGLLAESAHQDYVRATVLQEESLALAEEAGDNYGILLSMALGIVVAIGQSDYRRAKANHRKALQLSRRLKMRRMTVFQLHLSAVLASAQGQAVRTARLWGAARVLRETIGATFSPIQHYHYDPYVDAARAKLGEIAWETAFAEGQAMTTEEAVEYALSEEPATPPPPAPQRPSIDTKSSVVLTPREKEVAALVAQGLTNRRVASELSISEHTAATHVAKILKKLNLHSRSQLTDWVRRGEM